MPLSIIRNDITRVRADAIVNTANPHVAVGRGTDYAIYKAAGMEELLEARNMIGDIEPGHTAVTSAYGLDAKYIIHTVGPAWTGGDSGERETVASCYRNCLAEALRLKCESVAFPLISTGTYGSRRMRL
jgi:O-acetyl-ADP-ribose deacetylase (regulator of RNase III)